jgi:tetratricopeptide (TPR) repeat protein
MNEEEFELRCADLLWREGTAAAQAEVESAEVGFGRPGWRIAWLLDLASHDGVGEVATLHRDACDAVGVPKMGLARAVADVWYDTLGRGSFEGDGSREEWADLTERLLREACSTERSDEDAALSLAHFLGHERGDWDAAIRALPDRRQDETGSELIEHCRRGVEMFAAAHRGDFATSLELCEARCRSPYAVTADLENLAMLERLSNDVVASYATSSALLAAGRTNQQLHMVRAFAALDMPAVSLDPSDVDAIDLDRATENQLELVVALLVRVGDLQRLATVSAAGMRRFPGSAQISAGRFKALLELRENDTELAAMTQDIFDSPERNLTLTPLAIMAWSCGLAVNSVSGADVLDALDAIPDSTFIDSDRARLTAQLLLDEGRMEETVDLLAPLWPTALQNDDGPTVALYLMALLRLGDRTKPWSAMSDVPNSLFEKFPVVRLLYGFAALQSGHAQEIESHLPSLRACPEFSAEVARLEAQYLVVTADNPVRALALLESIEQEAGPTSATSAWQAACFYHLEDWSRAADFYAEALAQDDSFPYAQGGLARALMMSGDRDGALLTARRALQRDDTDHQLWMVLGEALLAVDKPRPAVTAYENARRCGAPFAAVLCESRALLLAGRPAEAARLLKVHSPAVPEDWMVENNLALAELALGNHREARRHRVRSEQLRPSSASASGSLSAFWLQSAVSRLALAVLAAILTVLLVVPAVYALLHPPYGALELASISLAAGAVGTVMLLPRLSRLSLPSVLEVELIPVDHTDDLQRTPMSTQIEDGPRSSYWGQLPVQLSQKLSIRFNVRGSLPVSYGSGLWTVSVPGRSPRRAPVGEHRLSAVEIADVFMTRAGLMQQLRAHAQSETEQPSAR